MHRKFAHISRYTVAAIFACCVVGQFAYSQVPAPPKPAAKPSSSVEQHSGCSQDFASELRMLRAEVLQLRIDAYESRREALEKKLEELNKQQLELRQEQVTYEQSLVEINRIVSQPMSGEERQQIETVQADMSGPGIERLRGRQAFLAKTEADLTQRLRAERQATTALRNMLQQILGAAK